MLKKFWPWSRIAQLESDLEGYADVIRDRTKDVMELHQRILRQSTSLREKNEIIDDLQLRISKLQSQIDNKKAISRRKIT